VFDGRDDGTDNFADFHKFVPLKFRISFF